jgi:hypothetical protein
MTNGKSLVLGLLLFCSFSFFLSAQSSTYSKIYDIPVGIYDAARGMILTGDEIIVNARHGCWEIDNIYPSCTSVNRFTLTGELIETVAFDSIFPEGRNRAVLFDGKYYLGGHLHGEVSNRATYLYCLDTDLNLLNQAIIPNNEPGIHNNEGLLADTNFLYLYGYTVLPSGTESRNKISKLNRSTFEVLWERILPTQHTYNRIYDLQFTPQGQLAVLRERHNGAGAGADFSMELLLLDTAGTVLQVLPTDDWGDDHLSFHVGQDGYIYYGTYAFPDEFLPESRGVINKINASLDTLQWSYRLPVNRFVLGRHYQMRDFAETANGDIVVCGTTWDYSDGGYQSNNQTYHGFIARVSPQGEKRWVRLYQHRSYVEPLAALGRYRPSFLNKIVETATGELIAAGNVVYDDFQAAALPDSSTYGHLWLLSVDANGCLAGEECKERIVLDSIGPPDLSLHVGSRWTYEEVNSWGSVGPGVYEIVDTTTLNDTLAYVVEKTLGVGEGQITYLHTVEDTVYHYNADEEHFELRFVYNAPTTESDLLDFIVNYEAPWSGVCHNELDEAQVYVDSVTQRIIGNYVFPIQHLRIANNGSEVNDLKAQIYTGIGNNESFRLGLGYGLCDPPWRTTQLRCFETNGATHHFVDYPCDSTWLISNTETLPEISDITVFPNPGKGTFQLRGLPAGTVPYTVYDLQGRPLQQGVLQEPILRLSLEDGVYLLQLSIDNKRMVTRKLVVMQ